MRPSHTVRGSGSTRDSQLRAVLAADVVVSVGSLLRGGLRPAVFFVVSVGSLLKTGLRPARRTHACRGIGRTSPDSVSFLLRDLKIYMDYT